MESKLGEEAEDEGELELELGKGRRGTEGVRVGCLCEVDAGEGWGIFNIGSIGLGNRMRESSKTKSNRNGNEGSENYPRNTWIDDHHESTLTLPPISSARSTREGIRRVDKGTGAKVEAEAEREAAAAEEERMDRRSKLGMNNGLAMNVLAPHSVLGHSFLRSKEGRGSGGRWRGKKETCGARV